MNEAMLTGESVPQIKESLSSADDFGSSSLDLGPETAVEAGWRRHLLFGGTALLMHSSTTDSDVGQGAREALSDSAMSSAPDGGCLAVVVRTGYGTSQVPVRLALSTATVSPQTHRAD